MEKIKVSIEASMSDGQSYLLAKYLRNRCEELGISNPTIYTTDAAPESAQCITQSAARMMLLMVKEIAASIATCAYHIPSADDKYAVMQSLENLQKIEARIMAEIKEVVKS